MACMQQVMQQGFYHFVNTSGTIILMWIISTIYYTDNTISYTQDEEFEMAEPSADSLAIQLISGGGILLWT